MSYSSSTNPVRRVLPLLLAVFSISQLRAQSFFTNPSQFITPVYRGTANSEFSDWDVFYSPYTGVNYPDMAAPNGTGGYASGSSISPPSNSNPVDPFAFWSTANPTITQTLDPRAFVVGPGTAGNLYSFSGPTGYLLQDAAPYTLGSVNLQWQNDGSLIDFSTLKLNYMAGGNAVSIAPANFIAEYQASGSSFGFSLRNRISAQWNLTGLSLQDYTITWQASGSSSSLQEVVLDTSAIYSEATPSTRLWNGGGSDSKWSTAANWASGAVPSLSGNVTFSSSAAVTLDSSREVSLLTLGAPTGVTIANSAGGKLKLNTGITATAGTHVISAPVTLGSFNLLRISAGADVSLTGPVDGLAGFYKTGGGILRFGGTLSVDGQVLIGGGAAYFSGVNTYGGPASIFSGSLFLQGNAPASAPGTLGNSSAAVSIGGGGTIGDPAAAVYIDGHYSVGRSFSIENGAEPKILGAQNTGAGASYNGSITLASAANEVELKALNANDLVSFSGSISGGGAGSTLKITGAGTVVFSGTNKTYLNDTFINGGTLQIAAGTALNGNGRVSVNANATLLVAGSLNGTGQLLIDHGTLAGSGTINRTFTLDNGGRLSPGNTAIGKLETIGETWAGGGRFLFEIADLNGNAGTGWDMVNMTGLLDLVASASTPFTLELRTLTAGGAAGPLAGFDPSHSYSWKFATASAGINGFSSNAFAFDTSGFAGAGLGLFSIAKSGNDLLLSYAIPEPNALLLTFSGAALLLRRCRRSS